MAEVWKDVPGFEGLYQVSDMGRVKSLARVMERTGTWATSQKERILKPSLCKGYRHVVLCKQGRRQSFAVHRLVALAFVPNPATKPQINHMDGNKENNRPRNLEWVTSSENNLHRRRVLNGGGGKAPRAVICLDTGIVYASVTEAAKTMGVDLMSILHACQGRSKSSCGCRWAYAEEVSE